MREITSQSDLNLDNNKYTIALMMASWCAPCKKLLPNLTKLEQEFGNDISFLSIDIDDVPALAKQYRIKSVPTIILFKNGRETDRIEGLVLIDSLRNKFRNLIKGKYNTADNYNLSAAE